MKVWLAGKAKKQLGRLPASQKKKIAKKLKTLEASPFLGKRLVGELAGIYSLRAWPYRILYQVDRKRKVVFIITIEHRQEVYK